MIANYIELKGKLEVFGEFLQMQNNRKKWDFFNFDFKSAPGCLLRRIRYIKLVAMKLFIMEDGLRW